MQQILICLELVNEKMSEAIKEMERVEFDFEDVILALEIKRDTLKLIQNITGGL